MWQLVSNVNLPQIKIIWAGSLNGLIVLIVLIDMGRPTENVGGPFFLSGSNPDKKGGRDHEWRKIILCSLGLYSELIYPVAPAAVAATESFTYVRKCFQGFWIIQRTKGSSGIH